MKTKLPVIYAYNNFRNYLADYQIARMAAEKKFSKSAFSKQLGLPNTRSYFADVLSGKKVTTAFIERFIRALELNRNEGQFFRVLVLFNQAESPDARELYFEQLISLNKTPKRIIDPKEYAYYKSWYNSVIRAVLSIIDWNGDYGLLARKVVPPITVKQSKEAVRLLVSLGLVAKNSDGFYKPTDKVIATSDYARDEIIRIYQHNCLAIAQEAVLRNRKQPQRVITKMVSVSEDGYRKIEKKIEQLNSAVTSLVHKEDVAADRVYQLAIILFPQSAR